MNRTTFRANRMNRALAPAAAVAMLTGMANAQFIVERSVDSAPEATRSEEQVVVIVDNGEKTELRIENGNVVRAVVNGENWPTDRVERNGDSVVLTGPDGKQIRTIVLRQPQAAVAPSAPGMSWVVRGEQAPAPKVMLGINLSEPGEALRAQLGLGDKPAILIEGVIDGLPAATSGIKQHDIVVSIDGSDGVSGQKLSELLAKAEPGTMITVKVLRGGETKTIKVELAAYDSTLLGVPTPPMPGGLFTREQAENGSWVMENDEGDIKIIIEKLTNSPNDPALLDELQKLTTERAKRLGRQMQGQAQELARSINAERMSELEAISEEAQRRFEDVMRDTRRQFVELRDGRLFIRSADEAEERLDALRRGIDQRAPIIQDQIDDRLRAMEDRLESVEHRLTERMERLTVLMERLAERAERAVQPQGERED